MGKGFGSVKAKQDKSASQAPELTPIDQIQADLSDCFTEIKDPRVDRTKKHLLKDILVISILAIIAGAEGWELISCTWKYECQIHDYVQEESSV